jgi:hypothetical protein
MRVLEELSQREASVQHDLIESEPWGISAVGVAESKVQAP